MWMKRPDLPGGHYNGWQVVDSTPQETSNGKYVHVQLGTIFELKHNSLINYIFTYSQKKREDN